MKLAAGTSVALGSALRFVQQCRNVSCLLVLVLVLGIGDGDGDGVGVGVGSWLLLFR